MRTTSGICRISGSRECLLPQFLVCLNQVEMSSLQLHKIVQTKNVRDLKIDESYFGVRKTRKKIRRTAGTIPFDLFKKK